ncbi:hypothetical protein, partial [Klebsiella aerogenes]|uniref:hypothetical protein n=1 Tax=Klebsiella aerogenes TaxID=548 RepID=UPI0019531427
QCLSSIALAMGSGWRGDYLAVELPELRDALETYAKLYNEISNTGSLVAKLYNLTHSRASTRH